MTDSRPTGWGASPSSKDFRVWGTVAGAGGAVEEGRRGWGGAGPSRPLEVKLRALASPFVEEGHAVVTPAASVSRWPQGSLCMPGTQSPGSSGVYGCTGAGQLETPSPRYEEVQTGGQCHWSSPLGTTFWRR